MIKKIMWNKYFVKAVMYLFAQQLIVASSTVWISLLGKAIVLSEPFSLYLLLFSASLFLVYFPGIAASYNLEKGKIVAIRKYVAKFSEKNDNQPALLSDKYIRTENEPWLTNEAGKTIEETYSVLFDSLATGLNTLLNVIALCIAIDIRIVFGYLCSFIILPCVARIFKKRLHNLSLSSQKSRKQFSQILLSGWDNITVGNTLNLSIWWTEFRKKWENYLSAAPHAVFITQLSSAFSMIIALIPSGLNFAWLFLETNNQANLVAMVATLPRQIQIIQHLEILSSHFMRWHGTYAKLCALIKTIDSPNPHNMQALCRRIHWQSLTFSYNGTKLFFESFDDFINYIKTRNNGRIKIQGKNGSGKTTLMYVVKSSLKDNAFYFPTNSRLYFQSIINDSFSSGQTAKKCLEEICLEFKKNTAQRIIVMLDEWDANLDKKNIAAVSESLDFLAEKHCVLEITHNHSKDDNVDITSSFLTISKS